MLEEKWVFLKFFIKFPVVSLRFSKTPPTDLLGTHLPISLEIFLATSSSCRNQSLFNISPAFFSGFAPIKPFTIPSLTDVLISPTIHKGMIKVSCYVCRNSSSKVIISKNLEEFFRWFPNDIPKELPKKYLKKFVREFLNKFPNQKFAWGFFGMIFRNWYLEKLFDSLC